MIIRFLLYFSLELLSFIPLKNSIRPADEFSSKLPVTYLYGAPTRGADSNLHWYKSLLGIPPITGFNLVECRHFPRNITSSLESNKWQSEYMNYFSREKLRMRIIYKIYFHNI